VIVRDDTREHAIERARRVLAEFEIVGVPTTRDVAREILDSPEFRSGRYSTSFLEEAGERLPSLAAA
jgi:biotin carboxylase